ncbi:unnamed protein product [Vitrella brassicaformis CCMP3155]|uniref:T6SS Phospholipase effector Tle1-like catalytic domain-containing protein n=1 Tax=Vitrella brassicaformis (strain CCMP3155) TaxID=1169540 RepID=A0A0G4E9I9_VITBC|nr:unnamed protein product [Vitrella brassicaformis CCMP3155]|eukprot:CEL92053.1 unnamed protein product [Vitrella brassicaformis CCMP3155]
MAGRFHLAAMSAAAASRHAFRPVKPKNLIFCFDGTCSDPEDAVQERTSSGGLRDASITNVLKLHLLFGGDLNNGNKHKLDQQSLYYPGVGTYGHVLNRIFNAGFALTDVGRIIKTGLKDLQTYYKDGDKIFVVGYSRGAAIARRFCSVMSKEIKPEARAEVELLICFDTVASIGMPDLNVERRPASDVVFENRVIASNIKQALHCVSLDEKRKAFQPTLMNTEERVTEVWFAGSHGDVGGGYRRDGLSDNVLRFVLAELKRRETGVVTIAPTAVKYDEISAVDDEIEIELDDLIVEANKFGISHEQSRIWPISKFTLHDRRAVKIKNDQITNDPPVIHHTVAERIYGDDDYRPQSLKKVCHDILYPDGTTVTFDNLAHHIRIGMHPLKPLNLGETRTLPVYAHQFYNRTGLVLEAGKTYAFEAKPGQTWQDGGIKCGAGGWDRNHPDVKWITDIGVRVMEPFRRVPGANWFCLIGAVGDHDKELFTIGTDRVTHIPSKSDEFCPFANDLKRMYANNDGFIEVNVTRLT